MELLKLEEVWAGYPGGRGVAVRGASIRLLPLELGLLIGPNGAGKTTILEVILGFLPYRGQVRVFGREIREDPRWVRLKMGYLPQALVFAQDTPCRTVDLVLMGRFGQYRPWKRIPRVEREKAMEALARFSLQDRAEWPVGHLSGGQQRKALLARAWAKGAELLLLDEPFASLDPEARTDLAKAVFGLGEVGMTVLAVVHEDELLARADRVWLVREGQTQPLPTPCPSLKEIWAEAGVCGS